MIQVDPGQVKEQPVNQLQELHLVGLRPDRGSNGSSNADSPTKYHSAPKRNHNR